jgi:TetR/AcrR family transcriptional regulator
MSTPKPRTSAKPTGRIRQKNEQAILAAAAEEFARHGYQGTSMNNVALRVGLPKANLHYYFSNKLGLYVAVMEDILALWGSTFDNLKPEDDPAQALSRYIRAKMEFSRTQPLASRIFAMEVISGGTYLSQHFGEHYVGWFRGRAAIFEAWIAAGKIDAVDPAHLIFLLWSSTQHYADFAGQISLLTGRKKLTRADFDKATATITHVVLKGCGLTPPGP